MNEFDKNLDALIKASAKDLLSEDIELFNTTDVSETKISDKALRRIRRKIRNYDKESWWSTVPMPLRRAVAAVLVICTISFCFCISIPKVRAEIVNTFMQWNDKFVAVFYQSEITPPSVIEEYREPMLQPAGAEKLVVLQGNATYAIIYFVDGKRTMFYEQLTITHNSIDIDSENCTVTDIKINEHIAKFFDYEDGMKKITWHDNEYAYIISLDPCDMSTDMLISIAESIK